MSSACQTLPRAPAAWVGAGESAASAPAKANNSPPPKSRHPRQHHAPARSVVGVHKLLLLNFYPYLQKYIAPHQRDVTQVLAALVQAAHELVPPETLAPVMRQLVDQFVHDR